MQRHFSPHGPTLRLLLLGLLGLPLQGCFLWTSRPEGTNHERRLKELENDKVQGKAEFEEQLSIAKQQVAEIEKILDQATDVVKRNSADLAIEVRALRQQVATLEGQIAELQNSSHQQSAELDARINQFAQKAGIDVPIDPKLIPQDPNEHYIAAYQAHQNNDHTLSRGLFRAYVSKYPKDTKAADAQYWIGASYLKQNRPSSALGEFRKVLSEYPQEKASNRALLGMADAFWQLKSCEDAKKSLQALTKRTPDSELSKEAEKRLKEWRHPPKNYCE